MKKDVIGLVTGLGSSLPFLRWIWTRWARKLEKRLKAHYKGRNDIEIIRVSSDGQGEKHLEGRIQLLAHDSRLGKVVLVGHSNGFRDALYIANRMKQIPVAYFAGIDMTLGEGKAVVSKNIKFIDEFKARYGTRETANFAVAYPKKLRYKDFKVNKGHTATANDKEVQDRIFSNITGVIR